MRSQEFYSGDGSTRQYNISFPFLSRDHVKVSVDEVDQEITWVSEIAIELATAPAVGAEVRVYRDTPLDKRLTVFENGAVLTENDLNSADIQLFYKQQELDDGRAALIEKHATDLLRSVRAPSGEELEDLPSADLRPGKYLGFDNAGNPTVLDPTTVTSADGQAVPTIEALASIVGPAAGQKAFVTHETRAGVFVFRTLNLADKVSADTQRGVYIAPDSDPTGASGAWVRNLASGRISPLMFGAVGDGETDDTVAVQAAFDFLYPDAAGRLFTLDLSNGEHKVSDTLYACYPITDGDQPIRKFIGGRFRVAPLAELPGGVPLDVVLHRASPRMEWMGTLEIGRSSDGTGLTYNTPYASRRFMTGVLDRAVSFSNFGNARIDDAKRDLVFVDSIESGGFTVRAGTPYETTYPNANNIGAKYGNIYGRTYGSTHTSAGHGASTNLVSNTAGLNTGGAAFTDAEAFTAGGAYGGAIAQRSQLVVGDTSDIETFDIVYGQLVLTPDIYGTIAYDNATSKIIWTAGDPTAYLNVGDIYPIVYNGANANVEHRIVSFGGISNREIIVSPAPVTQAASADVAYTQYGDYHYAQVSKVVDATTILTYPLMPTRVNSPLYIAHGYAFRSRGSDNANITTGLVGGLIGGGLVWGQALYMPSIRSVLIDYGTIGLRFASGSDTASTLGVDIGHGHLEGATVAAMSHSAELHGDLSILSSFDDRRAFGITAVADLNQQSNKTSLGRITLNRPGVIFTSPLQGIEEGASYSSYTLSNHPESREHFVHDHTATLNVDYRRDAAMFPKHHWASVIWTAPDGSAPTGTLTLNIDSELVGLGWQFSGSGSGTSYAITAPTSSTELKLQFLSKTKRIAIQRNDAI